MNTKRAETEGMQERVPLRSRAAWPVLAGAFLFNLGQGVLRPTMPLYLQHVFAADYRMVTLIPVVFGAGKWMASLPAGYLLDRLGRRQLMAGGLVLIALGDMGSVMTGSYGLFLALRMLAGVGWAAFSTVALTTMVDRSNRGGRGRAVSLLLMSETAGLLIGSTAGGWLYQGVAVGSPFLFEAACMLSAAWAIARQDVSPAAPPTSRPALSLDWRLLVEVLRIPGVLLMGVCNAVLIAIQAGVWVFLFPLYLVEHGGLGAKTVGFLVSLSVLGRLAGLWFGGAGSDRWGRLRVLGPALVAYAVLVGSVPLVTDSFGLGFYSLAIGVAAGSVAGLPAALVGDRVDSSFHGIAVGWLRTMTDAGHILGPGLMGMVADAVNLSTPFFLAAGLLFSIVASLPSARDRARRSASPS